MWAMLPQTLGAMILYDSFFKTFLKKNETRMNTAIEGVKKEIDKKKFRNEYVFIGGVLIFFPLHFSLLGTGGSSARYLCSIVGFVYPAFKSFQAIESPEKDDDTEWLTYWVVKSFLNVIEVFTDNMLSSWVPYYFPFKLVFLVWAMLPQTMGSMILYHLYFKNFLKENEATIDAVLNDTTKNIRRVSVKVSDAMTAIPEQSLEGKKNDKNK